MPVLGYLVMSCWPGKALSPSPILAIGTDYTPELGGRSLSITTPKALIVGHGEHISSILLLTRIS